MSASAIVKYGFRIRTRSGLIVDKLLIYGADESDAVRKLQQMYQHCNILECTLHKPAESPTPQRPDNRQRAFDPTTSQVLALF